MKAFVDLERVFDLWVHMNENAGDAYIFDKKKDIKLNYKQQGAVLHKSIQGFFQGVGVLDEGGSRVIQAFSGSGDLPQLTKDVFNVVNTVPNFDTFWQMAFQGIKLRKGQLSWEIADVASGIVFELIPEGDKAKFYGISGNIVTAKIDKYGAGIGVTWEMIEGRKLYQFIDLMGQVRDRLMKLWADIHYGLIATASLGQTVAYQGVATDPVLDRDIATLNLGYTTIGDATKDKGYGDTANAAMVLYLSPNLKARTNHAMRVTTADVAGGRTGGAGAAPGTTVEFNIAPRFSWNSAIPTNKGLLVLPGNKIQNAAYIQELSLNEKDISTLSELRTYWSAFGAIIADADQTAELSFI